jgi:hypothetical protein
MGTAVSKLAVGRDTVIGTGVGVGVAITTNGSAGKNPGCATTSGFGLPGAAGAAALKVDAKRIAETDSSTTERVTWSAAARAELFWRFFIFLLGQRGFLRKELSRRTFYAGAWTTVNIFLKVITFVVIVVIILILDTIDYNYKNS